MSSKSTRTSLQSKSKKNGDDESSTSSSSKTSHLELCVVCASEASNKIVRDSNFLKVMQFYVEGISIDVKPMEYTKYELCGSCFESLVEFYDTNDVLLLLETHLKNLRRGIVSQTLTGIGQLKKEGRSLLPIHEKVTQKYGNGETLDLEKLEVGSSVTSSLEDTPTKGQKDQNKNVETPDSNKKARSENALSLRPRPRSKKLKVTN